MALRASKPSFNVREKLTELGRRFGLKGSELVAAETIQDARDLVSAGRKNLIINGSMEIAQRGTSGTKSGSAYGGYLCVDRWACYYDDTTMEQVERTINGKLKKALKVTAAGSNGRPYVYHKIENSSKILGDGTQFSISFWMRSSASTRQQLQWRYYDNGTENNSSNSNIVVIDVSTEWKYYKIENISVIDASQNRTRDGGLWIYNTSGDVGSGLWIEFTDVQVELGKQCTDFEHRSYGEELARCQRYYQKVINSAGGTARTFVMGAYVVTRAFGGYPLSTPMRSDPDVTFSGLKLERLNLSASYTVTDANTYQTMIGSNAQSMEFNVASGLTGNTAYYVSFDSGGYLAFDSEL